MNVTNCKRNINLDLLAIVASFLVVFLHQAAQIAETNIIINIYRIIAECAVPLFVMKSGALLLSKKKNVDYRYIGRAALRIVAIIVLWGLFYHSISNMLIDGVSWLAVKKAIISVITAETTYNYQFWYLYMLLGLFRTFDFKTNQNDTRCFGDIRWNHHRFRMQWQFLRLEESLDNV